MKILRQFFIIIFISFIGELLKRILPLPVPASISGKLKAENIREVSYFLIEIMPIMFLPAAVGLIGSWSTLKPIFIPIIVTTLLSTILVMGISAKVTEIVILFKEKRQK